MTTSGRVIFCRSSAVTRAAVINTTASTNQRMSSASSRISQSATDSVEKKQGTQRALVWRVERLHIRSTLTGERSGHRLFRSWQAFRFEDGSPELDFIRIGPAEIDVLGHSEPN